MSLGCKKRVIVCKHQAQLKSCGRSVNARLLKQKNAQEDRTGGADVTRNGIPGEESDLGVALTGILTGDRKGWRSGSFAGKKRSQAGAWERVFYQWEGRAVGSPLKFI
jgi:hypothetical protein